jgi:hypothetical protein
MNNEETAPVPRRLELVEEHKLPPLLGPEGDGRWEASGVCAQAGQLYVIFDNTPHVARLPRPPWPDGPRPELIRQRGESVGYEDVTYDPATERFYLLIEAEEPQPGVFQARIETYDRDFRYLESAWVDFPLERPNKGLEGLTSLARGGTHYLLALCEGNKCHAGALGRKPGGGRIHVLQRASPGWEPVAKLKLPKAVRFEDYASLDIDPASGRVAVVSQMSAALWVGQLRPDEWAFADDGQVYAFPTNADGQTAYCNVEGVAWLAERQVVVVSDRAKAGEQPKKCRAKDQSLHVFNLPAG